MRFVHVSVYLSVYLFLCFYGTWLVLQRMEEDLKKLKETNMSLRRQIGYSFCYTFSFACNIPFFLIYICFPLGIDRQRTTGENLNDLSFEELVALEHEMEDSLQTLRQQKVRTERHFFYDYKLLL